MTNKDISTFAATCIQKIIDLKAISKVAQKWTSLLMQDEYFSSTPMTYNKDKKKKKFLGEWVLYRLLDPTHKNKNKKKCREKQSINNKITQIINRNICQKKKKKKPERNISYRCSLKREKRERSPTCSARTEVFGSARFN